MPPYVNPITQPYGDISTFQAPHLDNTVNMLYQERKQQQAKREAELAAIDDDMNKEYSKVRSQDIPEFTNAWSDYRKTRIVSLFDKNLQRDPIAFQNAKRAEQLALGKVYEVGNGSAEYKDHLKQVQEWAKTHPEELPENYGQLMTTAMNLKSGDNPNLVIGKNPDGTPIVKNLRDPLSFRELTPTYNFTPIIDKAAGTPQPTGFDETPIGTKGLQIGRQEYKSTAVPSKVYESIMTSMSDADPKKSRSARKTAAQLGSQISDEDYAKVEQAYISRNPDDLRKQGEKLVRFDTPKTPEQKYAQVVAMQYGINKAHTLGDYKPIEIEENKMAAQAAKERQNAVFNSDLRKGEDEYRDNLKRRYEMSKSKGDDKSASLILDRYIQSQYNEGLPERPFTVEGKQFIGRQVKLSPDLAEKYYNKEIVNGDLKVNQIPSSFIITNDKKYLVPIFSKQDGGVDIKAGESGSIPIKTKLSELIPIETVYKADLGGKLLTKKDSKAEFADDVPIKSNKKLIKGF